jgi:hypothetical protein
MLRKLAVLGHLSHLSLIELQAVASNSKRTIRVGWIDSNPRKGTKMLEPDADMCAGI